MCSEQSERKYRDEGRRQRCRKQPQRIGGLVLEAHLEDREARRVGLKAAWRRKMRCAIASEGGLVPQSDKDLSKFLSLVLRHKPELLGVVLDRQGWVPVDELLVRMAESGRSVSREQLERVVAGNDKKRFAFDATGTRLRAVQGHSLPLQMDYTVETPPAQLFHGTAARFLASIKTSGLERRERQYVHLSLNPEVALTVGKRHGVPIVLTVDAAAMLRDGYIFHRADNGVWLTATVPVTYLRIPSPEKEDSGE